MKTEALKAIDVVGARDEILGLIQRNPNNNIIYFDGWNGFGATTVLRSIAQALPSMKNPPSELCFGRTIYIDCSRWESKRVMQRKIAEALKFDEKIMAMFDEQDEEDDFNGVDHASRDVLRQVSAMIDQTLRQSRFIMFFLNGSQDEAAFSEFGIPEYHCTIIWTFRRRFVAKHEASDIHKPAENLRRTFSLFIYTEMQPPSLSDSQINALFREEAANIASRYPFIMRDIDLTMVIDCCCYGFFLCRKSHNTIGLEWAAHAPNFWICDGIIQKGDRTREIVNALDSEINFNGDDYLLGKVIDKMTEHSESSHLRVEDEDDGNIDKYKKRPYRWIFVTSKKKVLKDNMETILATASSIFLSFDKTVSAPRLPNALFKQCSKLGVLVLSYCAFSFASPPFLHCNTLRFLGLGNCTHQNNNTSELEGGGCVTKWTSFLQNLLVLDMRYTDWVEILSEEKIGLMANLTELNTEGVRCLQYTCQLLHKRLPYLQRLRITKPAHQQETSMDMDSSFVDKKELEILDFSSNRYMKSLPGSLSEASKLQVLVLDGCDGLENVVLPSSSLRSFSFDGYGPASHWTSTGKLPPMSSRPKRRSAVDKDVRTSKISLEGCTLLEDLFLRGLPNLEELDLSGCAIKVLDFGAMVVDVLHLKRLFLLGCENLRAIKWGTYEQRPKLLELICIDTRPRVGCARPLFLCAQQKSFQLQVHAIFADARLARSLWAPIYNSARSDACYFNISITSSAACMETIQPEATTDKEKVTGSIDHQRHYDIASGDMYRDVFTKVGDGPAPMQAFPQGPMGQLDCHIEIGDGNRSVQSELEEDTYSHSNQASLMRQYNESLETEAAPFIRNLAAFLQSEVDSQGRNLASLMTWFTKSLHVHDVLTCSNIMHIGYWFSLMWCRVERCPNLHAIFPPGSEEDYYSGTLETIWASDLLMARCVWSKGIIYYSGNRFRSLRHLHLRSCPSLRFGLAMGARPSFPSLETLHIIHCGNLRHIFVPGDEKYQHASVKFPKLTTIHLHDLPALQQICEAAAEMLAPALETIQIRGCWSLRRLPALKGREPGMRKPAVEIEKDVWDALEWDGVDAGHHPSLYQAPVHSRYYKRRMLRTTVLR